MGSECMLSFIDNPYDYFTDVYRWRMFDIEYAQSRGISPCCEYLARIAKTTDDMSQKEIDNEIERAIDEIIEINPLPIFKKVWNKSQTS